MRGELRQFLNAAAQLGFNFVGCHGINHPPLHNADTGTTSWWRTHHPIDGRNTASRPTTRTISPSGGAISRHPSQHPVVGREHAHRQPVPRWFHNRPCGPHRQSTRVGVARRPQGAIASGVEVSPSVGRGKHRAPRGHTPPPPETSLSRGRNSVANSTSRWSAIWEISASRNGVSPRRRREMDESVKLRRSASTDCGMRHRASSAVVCDVRARHSSRWSAVHHREWRTAPRGERRLHR